MKYLPCIKQYILAQLELFKKQWPTVHFFMCSNLLKFGKYTSKLESQPLTHYEHYI